MIFKIKSKSAYLRKIITFFLFTSLIFNGLMFTSMVSGETEKNNKKGEIKQDIIEDSFAIDNNEQTGFNSSYTEIKKEYSEPFKNNLLTVEQKTALEVVEHDTTQDSNFPISFGYLLGGNNSIYIYAVAVDSSDNIILTGYTHSSDFPILNAYDNTLNGNNDVFVTKFSSSGSLLWSTYLGGESTDSGYDVAVDSSDNIIVTGRTTSSDFPTLNAYDSILNGYLSDVFVTKFSSSGSLLWSTYLGGESTDSGYDAAIAIDSSDNIIVSDTTYSSDFPTLNAFDNILNGSTDVFVTKFTSSGSLLWSTYLGGESSDSGYDVTIDKSDNIIVTGTTSSSDFPTLNASDNILNGSKDIFITKFTDNGYLLWSTYLGGISIDKSSAIAVDSSDNIILTGHTSSTDFPTLNVYGSTLNGGSDIFITKFTDNGSLLWSTYFGGSKDDFSYAVTIDKSDNIIVTGTTYSLDFPTFYALQNTIGGQEDSFITKFSSTGSLISSTYIGGSDDDRCRGLTIDNNGNIIMIGTTFPASDFPTTDVDSYLLASSSRACFLIKLTSMIPIFVKVNNGYNIQYSNLLGGNLDSSHARGVKIDHSGNTIVTGFTMSYNNSDVFVTKFSNSGSLLWSTYLGGNSSDFGYAIAIDSSDNIIVTGYTYSSDFPTLNAYDSTLNGYFDVFVTKFASDGSLLWSTYLGGGYYDFGYAVAVDSSDNIIITGNTHSSDFPTLNAYDSTYKGYNYYVFVTKFTSDGSLLWSTYLGGENYDSVSTITIDSFDNIIVAGDTHSSDFPTLNAYDSTYNDYFDVFVTKFTSSGSLLWSTFLGGISIDKSSAIAVDSSDSIILTGYTYSSDIEAYNSTLNGYCNVFVTKFASDGSLLWSNSLGGNRNDYSTGIVINSFDEIFITGYTFSPDFITDSSIYFIYNDGYSFLARYHSTGELLDINIFGGLTAIYCYSLAYNPVSEEISLAGHVAYSNKFLGKDYPDLDNDQNNAFVLCISTSKSSYNPKNGDSLQFQTILNILIVMILVLLCILCSFASYKLFYRRLRSDASYKIFNLPISDKRQTKIIREIIEEAKSLADIEDHTVEINSPLWNIAKEFNNFERKKSVIIFRKFSTEGLDKAIFDLPSSLNQNDEKLLMALSKVILKRKEQLFLSYLNSKINDKITKGSFTLNYQIMISWLNPGLSHIYQQLNERKI